MKKILVLFTVMCVALVATAQKNMDGIVFGYKYHSNELYYKIHGKEVSVTSSVRSANYTKTLEIPREVRHKGKTYRVTGIEKYGISDATNVQKIVVPGTVKRVEAHTFKDCPNLREIHCEGGVQSVSGECFLNCNKMKELYVPSNCNVPDEYKLADKRVKLRRK